MHRTTVYNDIALLEKAGVYVHCYRARANQYYLESRKFELPELKDVVYVNKYAVVEKDDTHYVYILGDQGLFSVVEVKIGESVENDIIIKEGLEGGEIVQVF